MHNDTSNGRDESNRRADGGEGWDAITGIGRALRWGSLMAVVLAIVLAIIAWHAPNVLPQWVTRMNRSMPVLIP